MEKTLTGSAEAFSALEVTADVAGLDAASKEILKHKEILAIIARGTIDEYSGYSAQEIMDFIEEDSISSAEVSRGRTNTVIHGEPTEFTELHEKAVMFDVRFKARNPKLSSDRVVVNLHVDIEPQKNYNLGYPIEKRGIYYLARSLSAQLNLLTEQTDYGQLEKCYSIWICRDHISKKERFSISHYQMCNVRNIGNCHTEQENYDLLHMVIVRLGEDAYDGDENELFEFLTALFYPHRPGFRKTMEKFIKFEFHSELEEEVTRMSGLGQSILEEGIEQGIEQGIRALIETCRDFGISKDDIVAKLMQKFALSKEDAEKLCEKYGE